MSEIRAMHTYRMFIDGMWVDAVRGERMPVLNPATEEVFATVPLADERDVDRAVAAARRALPEWSRRTQSERSAIVNRIAAAIREHAEELATTEMLDHGMPISMCEKFAVPASAAHCEYMSQISMALTGDLVPVKPDALTYIRRDPIGVCALIAPWNVPLVIAAEKLAPALVMGNTCVLKPASVDSLSALKLVELLEGLDIPAGAVNVVTGPGSTVGDYLASHPGVDMVSFTGSSKTGKTIAAACAKGLKHVGLELGGKNPFIVLADADLEATVDGAVFASYFNTGMICGAPGRYYVHEGLHDAFVERFVEASRAVVVGDPADPRTQMGPVVSAEHRESVEAYIRAGVEEGAKLVLGGKRPSGGDFDRGFFVSPTIFADVTQNMKIAREEIFGPVGCIIKFSDRDDVLAMANDNTYGLVGSVWTTDLAKGLRYAEALHTGWNWVNEHIIKVPHLPWGGVRDSGLGVENSMHGLRQFTRTKVIYAELSQDLKKPWHVL